ncbi:MAG: phosphoribosylanthranilate isomerase [Thermomicrobiales bacterium]
MTNDLRPADLRPATLIKICGVRTPEHALVAAEAGADLVGLNFYPSSHRYVSVAEAAAVVRALRDHGHVTAAVGLFVNETPARINSIAAEVGLDIVQLHGDEQPGDLCAITLPVLRAIRLTPDTSLPRVRERISASVVMAQGRPDGPLGQPLTPLLDAHAPGLYGGTGVQADWSLAARLAALWPLFLAGGLTPENVGDAVRAVQPLGVDVSSGVETNKVKDPAKIRAFIAAVRAATTAATRPKQHIWRPERAEKSPA